MHTKSSIQFKRICHHHHHIYTKPFFLLLSKNWNTFLRFMQRNLTCRYGCLRSIIIINIIIEFNLKIIATHLACFIVVTNSVNITMHKSFV